MFSPGKKFKLFLTSIDLKDGHLAFIWGQHESKFDDYARLEQLLHDYDGQSSGTPGNQFAAGDIVVAKYEDGSWYRSQILEEGPDHKFKVLFMDFGNVEVVAGSDLHAGQPSLFELPPLATKFLMGDICAKNGTVWSEQEMTTMEEHLTNREVLAEVIGSEVAGVLPTVKVFNESRDLLCNQLFEKSVGSTYANEHLNCLQIQSCKLAVGKQYQVYISFTASAMKFWIHLRSLESNIDKMELKLLEYIENGLLKLKPEEIKYGMPCVAKYVEADTYYRAVITSTDHKEGMCTVNFVDYGNSEKVEYSDLYMLPREEATMHALCVECSLTGKAVRTTDFNSLIESEHVTIDVLSHSGNTYIVAMRNSTVDQSHAPGVEERVSDELSSSAPSTYVPVEVDPGRPHHVCISHVENDGSFHLQFLEYAADLERQMTRLMDKIAVPLLGMLERGKPCLVKDPKDMISYRGEIMTTDAGTVPVKLVDFGNVEGFAVADLYGIDPDSMKLPTQAQHCVLIGANTQNSRQLLNLLKSYESCKVLVCSVGGRTDTGKTMVELYDPSNKNGDRVASLVNNVESSSRRTASEPSSKIVSSSPLNPSSCVFLPPAEVKSQTVDRFYVMAVMSDSEIYCQLLKYSQENLDAFQAKLQQCYSRSDIPSLSSPKVGDICCTRYSEDDQFYRSKVLGITAGSATILFVDYGNQETMPLSALKELAPQFCNLPVQGVVCCFDESYSGLNTQVLNSLADHELVANVVKKEPTRIVINLTSSKENVSALKILEQYKRHTPAARPKADQLHNEYKKLYFEKDMWDECIVTFADDPQSFYLQLTSHTDDLNSVMEKLESYCGDAAQPDVLGLSLPVAAKYSDDGEWYRAVITGILKNGNVEVFFVDFGNTDTIPGSDLRKLTPELLKTPVKAVKCKLNRVKPGSAALWSPGDIEEFHKMVLDNTGSDIFKVQIGSYIEAEDTYYVELFRKDVNLNESFLVSRDCLKLNDNAPGIPPAVLPFIPSQQKASAPNEVQNSGWAGWSQPPIPDVTRFEKAPQKAFGSDDRGGGFESRGSGDFESQSSKSSFGKTSDKQNSGRGGFESSGQFGQTQGGFSDSTRNDGGGGGNKGGCFKCGEDGHISRNCPSAEKSGGGGGWNKDEMLEMAIQRSDVGKVIGKAGSRIKELQEISGARIRVLSKDATGDEIPVEIYGTEEQRLKAKEMIDELINTIYGSGSSGNRRENNAGFSRSSTNTSNSWDTSSGTSERRGFNDGGTGSGGFNRPTGGFGGNKASADDWGDSRTATSAKSFSDRKQNFGENNSFNQNRERSFETRGFSRDSGFSSENGRCSRPDIQRGSSGLKYKETNLPLNQYKELVVAHHETPGIFYFQLQETYAKLEELMEKIQAFYEGLDVPDMALLNVIQDRICVAKYSEDDQWYRAKVISAKGGLIRVIFVDYGNEEDVPPTAVKEIKEEFLHLPMQAVAGKVFGVQPTSGKWSLEAINRFIELTPDIIIGTAVEKRNDGSFVMELASENRSVHEVLIKEGLAIEEHADVPVPQAASRRKLSTSSASSTSSSRAGDLRLRELTMPCSEKVQVYISYVSSPALFWVNYKKNMSEMDDLMSRLQDQYGRLTMDELAFTNPEIGQLCCARYEQDKSWYRGKIKEVKKDKVLVDFVDYGNEQWMKYEDIQQIVRSFTLLPAQAIPCILDGAVPTGGRWANEGIVKFEELTEGDADELLALVNSKESPYYVSLIQRETGLSVAEELVNAGYARHGRPPNQSAKFKPRTMTSGDTLEVVMSWVTSHKEFYCQIGAEADNLLSLQENLSQYYEKCRLKDDMLHDPKVGDMCVAYYAGDGNWYRGLVQKVSDSSMALVKYIDYGNREKVQKTKLKLIKPEFETFPTFALKCSLKEAPGGELINWDEKAIHLFRKLTQEKLQCRVDSIEKDLHSVDLLDPSGRSIIDHLLGRENSKERANQHGSDDNKFDRQNQSSFTSQNSNRSQGGRSFGAENDSKSNDRFHNDRSSQGGMSDRNRGGFGDSRDNRQSNFSGRSESNRGGSFDTKRNQDSWNQPKQSGGFGNAGNSFGAPATTGDSDWGDGAGSSKDANSMVGVQKTVISAVTTTPELSLPQQVIPQGKQEVYISSVVSPSDFYVQLLSTENEILEKTDQLSAEYESLPSTSRKDVVAAVGQLCCAKFVDDEGWYRARITSVTGDKASVTFIDYGNTEAVEVSSLRSLTAEHCKSPPLAYNCKLDKFSLHETEDTAKLQEIAEEGVKVLLVEFVSSGGSPPYKVVLYDPECPEASLALQLPSCTKQPAPTSVCYPKVEIPSGEIVGYVSHIDSPSSFAVQLQSQENDLMNVTSMLESYASSGDKLEDVCVGCPCVAQFSEDQAWYRSVVVSLDEGVKATVEFVDYGNTDTVIKDSLKQLNESLLKYPPFAMKCSLDSVTRDTYSDEVIESFSAFTVDKVSKIRFISQTEPCSVVIHEDNVCVNDKIKEQLTATSDDSANKTELEETSFVSFPPQPKLSGRYQAFIHHVETPSELYFQLLRDEHEKNELYDQLDQIYEESSVEILTPPQVGGACCVKDSVNHTWNRSEILSISSDKVSVRFVDFGNCEEVNRENLRILRPQFLEHHAMTFKAKLSGISEAKHLEWPQDVCDKLFEETTEKVINIDIQSDAVPYEIVILYNNQNINNLILEDLPKEFLVGAGLPSDDNESEQYESAVDEVPDESDSVQEAKDLGEDTTINLYSDLQDTFDEAGSSLDRTTTPVPGKVSQFKTGDMVEVYIAHHISPSQFWVHLESQLTELEQFTESLQHHYSSDGKAVSIEDVYMGKMFVAKYSDEQWYRAVVKGVTDTGVEVLFIDFGNTETVAVAELREIQEPFREPLAFAIACVQHGIRAKDGEWDDLSLETFESLSTDQKLTAEVALVNCEEGDSLYVVKLFDASGNSLAETMLERGMAEDVTSPLVRSRKCSEETVKSPEKDLPKFAMALVDEAETEIARPSDVNETGMRHFSVEEVQSTFQDVVTQLEQTTDQEKVLEYKEADLNEEKENVLDFEQEDVENDSVGGEIISEASPEVNEECTDLPKSEHATELVERLQEVHDESTDLPEREHPSELVERLQEAEDVGDESGDLPAEVGDDNKVDVTGQELPKQDFMEENLETSSEVVTQEMSICDAFQFSTVSSELGCKVEGHVVHIESPTKFWIHLKEFSERFENLVSEIQEYYSSLVSSLEQKRAFEKVVTGCTCMVYSSQDEMWYRAVTQSSSEKAADEVTVLYVDYGMQETLSLDNLQTFEPRFGALPIQALECSLNDIEPSDGNKWDPEAADILAEITMDKNLLIEVTREQDKCYTVVLLDMGIPVANRLVAEGLARRTGDNPDLTLDESRLDLTAVVEVDREDYTKVEDVAESERKQSDGESEGVKCEGDEDLKSTDDKQDLIRFQQPDLLVGSSVEVYIPHVDTPDSFYCQLVTSSAELPLFADRLVDFYSNLKEGESLLDDLSVGQACVAQFPGDLSWYRATVTDITDSGVHMFFVDYGNTEIVRKENIRAVHQDFLNFPVQVFRCRFSSLKPLHGTVWEAEICSRLQEICSGIDTYDNKVFKATLAAVKLNEFGVIENVDVNVWDGDVNIPEQLVQGGYAKLVEQPVAIEESETDHNLNQFAADIVSNTIELGKQKFLKQKQEESCQIDGEGASKNVVSPVTSTAVGSFVLPELQDGDEVEVVFLHGTSPDDLYLQVAGRATEELLMLMSSGDSRSEGKGEDLADGQPCVCFDEESNQWQRGKVLSLQEDYYEVELVDLSKTRIFPRGKVSNITNAALKIPLRVVKCKLAGIRCIAEGTWSAEACDKMQEFCRNKTLTSQIVESQDAVYSIFLHNYAEDSSVSINHQLVLKGLAAFAEGYAMDLESELNPKIENTFNDVSLCMSDSLGSLDEAGVVESCDDDAFRHLRYHVGQTVNTVFVNCNENHLVCQPVASQEELHQLNIALNECYDQGNEPTLASPQRDQPCCVKSAVDDSWHRAVVLDVTDSPFSMARCYAVDTGDSIATSLDQVKLLRQKFFALPAQAIVVTLTGAEDLCGKSTEIYNFLESQFGDEDGKVCLCLQIDRVNSDNNVQATVFMNSGNTIKDELLENRILLPLQKSEAQEAEMSSESEDPEARMVQTPVNSLPNAIVREGVSQSVILSHAESPNSLWCQLLTPADKLQELLDEYEGKTHHEGSVKLQEGHLCVAFSSEKNCWRRAKIQSEYGGLYSVQYLDSGICDTTETVLPMPQRLSEIPCQAVHCRLPNLQPRDSEWSSEVEDLLNSYVDEKKQFQMTVHTWTESAPTPVDLFFLEETGELSLADILLDKRLAKTGFSANKQFPEEMNED